MESIFDEDTRKCDDCGCTQNNACVGGCYWITDNLCSSCLENKADHDLKIGPVYFEAVIQGLKNFEIRRNDRNFKVEDIVNLRELEKGMYTGRILTVEIIYITDFEQKEDYVVFGFAAILPNMN
ncbi:hypothetical protein A5821_002173 [Enterococcus sp. 7F3_DIV0205]|uniref:DUF3850 domain-containing protein n=1 Tax=Candidatus Enterococcus palustris TaxID=1834189 RepID=A0AAQ3Y6H5_9ENTE|nr:DUF3850 domain-containing protein [Enterococcus sp. 7F3_DIV0205]OTN82612.1 hypothetical protein A5821_002523 [Enterococcus sp. 7F3_DIV0205]